MREFSKRLKKARNKSHSHIDREYAADPDKLWSEVAIKESELVKIANDIAEILSRVLWERYQFSPKLSFYDAADVRPILECLDERGLGNFVKR